MIMHHMGYRHGDRVRDINPDRTADRAADPSAATGTVVRVEWEDENSPTVYVQWDGITSGPDAHGVTDIEPLND